MPEDDQIKRVPINRLHQEDGAHELASSPDMQPYLGFIEAVMQDADPSLELERIRELPLEKRYVWRVVSALKWAFADFDDLSVTADKETLTPADFARIMDLLRFRPVQLAMFLMALVGAEKMEQIMFEAVMVARQT